MPRILALMAVLAFCLSCGGEASGEPEPEARSEGQAHEQMPHNQEVSIGDFAVSLQIEGELLLVTMSAPTQGWLSIGFDPSGAMKDADIKIGYVADGQVYLRDDFGTGYTSHEPDADIGGTSDITDISGYEENGRTTISFTMPLDSGDDYDIELSAGSTHELLLAYGDDDSDGFDEHHSWVEVREIEL